MDRIIHHLNFSRLVRQYIGPFHTDDPESALKYAYLIALGGDSPAPLGDRQKQFALEVVRDIGLASKDNKRKLLGAIARDGSVKVSRSIHTLFAIFTDSVSSLELSRTTYLCSSSLVTRTTSARSCSPLQTNLCSTTRPKSQSRTRSGYTSLPVHTSKLSTRSIEQWVTRSSNPLLNQCTPMPKSASTMCLKAVKTCLISPLA